MLLYNDQPQHRDQLPDEGPGHRPGRRAFLVTSLGTGFALAVDPVMAQVITTPSDGLVAGEVKVKVADGEIPAYRAMPEGAGPFPTMIVIEEIFGLHEYIKDICRRFAKLGYFAIAPELFARQGDATKADIKTILTEILPKKPDAEAMSDLDATVAYAAATGKADTEKRGAIGFCWGGRQLWLYAEHDPKLKAAVAFYGLLGGEASPTTPIKPTNPIDIGAKVTVPVLGLYGGHDDNIPPELIDRMKAELKGTRSEIVVYPDAPHGFFADYRPSYRPAEAKDAWAKALAWFRRTAWPDKTKDLDRMIYELRIYTTLPGRLPNLLARFENHTLRIWEKHGIRQAGFWTTLVGPDNNDLTYLLAWESLAERERKWSAFMSDPEWIAVRAESEKDGPINARVASSFLAPTAFSAVK